MAQFARSVMQAFGGLDVVINLVPLAPAAVGKAASLDEIERRVAQRLLLPCLIAKIAANRMALSYIEGLILNVAMLTPPLNGPAQAFACVAKSALTAMTRAQAEEWAGKAIRFNAIAPQDRGPAGEPSLAGEPEVAELALYLASGRGKALSGTCSRPSPSGVGAERVFDELDDRALRSPAVERLRPAAAQGEHLGERPWGQRRHAGSGSISHSRLNR